MTRRLGPSNAFRTLNAGDGRYAGRSATVWADAAATVPADLRGYQPQSPTNPGGVSLSSFSYDSGGVVPLLWSPDNVSRVFVRTPLGEIVPMDWSATPEIDLVGDSAGSQIWPQSNLISSGEETVPRDNSRETTLTIASQNLRLTYFTARKTETTTPVRTLTGGTAAAAAPTLCRVGLYLIDPTSGDGTLVAAIANDTTLWAATNTPYTRSWIAPYAKIAGQRYALGYTITTGVATPTFVGASAAGGVATEAGQDPRLAGLLTGQADLPNNFSGASVANT